MLRLFADFGTEHRGVLLAYVAILCLLTVERVAVPHFYGKLLNYIKGTQFGQTTKMVILLIVIYATFQILDTVLTVLDAKVIPAFEAFVRTHVVDTIVQRHREQYTELDLGNITSKLIKLPANMRTLFYRTKKFLFNHVLAVLITAGYLFYCHPYLGSLITLSFVVLALVTWSFCSQCSRPSYAREETFDDTQEAIQDLLYNLLSVYSSQTEEEEKHNLEQVNAKIVQRMREYIHCGIPYRIIYSFVFLCVFAGILWLGIHLYKTHRIALPILISSFMVTFSMLKTCISFYFDFDSFIYLYGGIKLVADYLEHLPTPCKQTKKTTPPPVPVKTAAGIHIEFRHLRFMYPSQEQQKLPLFEDFNLTIPENQRIALMGGIGSGKSTLAQLLLRLQCYHGGDILINGRSITDINLAVLRRTIHYVPQHPRLFNRTLWKNLSYGNQAMTAPQVYRVLQHLKMNELENTFRHMMYHPVGKQGQHLSGGQRQMVGLLRALFSDSPVLILDEPTSSLDETSRDHVLRLVRLISQNKTLIIITHDPDLLAMVERVVHIEKGVIVQDEMLRAA